MAAALAGLGVPVGFDLRAGPRIAIEVYPHPALVRLLRLPRIVKYKRGPAAVRRSEFRRLQRLLRRLLAARFPFLDAGAETRALLAEPWSRRAEDLTDALVCALVGLWHLHHRGRRSQVIGELATGFLLLPEALRPGRPPSGRAGSERRAGRAQGSAASASSSARRSARASASGSARRRATSPAV